MEISDRYKEELKEQREKIEEEKEELKRELKREIEEQKAHTQKQLEKQKEEFEREREEYRKEFKEHIERTWKSYSERENFYKTEKENKERERDESLSKLSERAIRWYPGVIGGYFAIVLVSNLLPLWECFKGFKPLEFSVFILLPLILTVTLILSPMAWRIRILNRKIEKLWALEEHSYSNSQLSAQLNECSDDDPNIRKELLKKFFDHHDKRGSSQLIADWDRPTEKDSNDNIVQTIANRSKGE